MNKRPMWQRIIALAGVILLALMIVATLVCAIAGAEKNVVFALLICDMIIPIFIWVFLWITGIYKKKGEDMAREFEKRNEK